MKPIKKLSLQKETLMNLDSRTTSMLVGAGDPPNTNGLCPISNGASCDSCKVACLNTPKCGFTPTQLDCGSIVTCPILTEFGCLPPATARRCISGIFGYCV
jgi:hypothetical protein